MKQYNIKIWSGEKLKREICIDVETNIAPFSSRDHRLITFQAYDGTDIVYFVEKKDLKRFFNKHLNSIFILQNATFDVQVLLHEIPKSIITEIYDENRIRDTKILYSLLKLAAIGEVPQRGESSLKSMCRELLNRDISKDADVRMTFDQFINTPILDIPEKWLRYAADDVVHTFDLYCKLLSLISSYDEDRNLLSHDIQIKGDLALDQMKKNGIGVNTELRDLLINERNIKTHQLKDRLAMWGWIRGKPGNKEVLLDLLRKFDVYDKLPRTEKGNVSTKAEDLKPYFDKPFLEDYIKLNTIEKQIDYLNSLSDSVVHPEYNYLVETGRTSCVKRGTIIDTLYGNKKIEDIKLGDLVYTHKKRWMPVTSLMIKSPKPMYKIYFSNGKNITVASTHRFLTVNNEWVYVEEILDEYNKKHIKKQRSSGESIGTVQIGQTIYTRNSSQTDQNYGTQCSFYFKKGNALRGVQGLKKDKVLLFKTGEEKPHVRENKRKASSLEGSSGGWSWVSNSTMEWEKGIYSQSSFYGISGFNSSTREYGCTSYRRGQEEQRNTQSSSSNLNRTSKNTQYDEENDRGCFIEEIRFEGSHEVYDISVLEDESYLASGVFSHNCSKPNFQNPPRGDVIRNCFIPKSKDNIFIDVDYSAIELSTLAQNTYTFFGYSKMRDIINEGRDLHKYFASKIYNKDEKDVLKHERQFAKVFNFGLGANMGANTFVDYAKPQGIILTAEESQRLKDLWSKKTFPEMQEFYRIPYNQEKCITSSGRVRGDVSYTAHLNTYFQGMAADGAKLALYRAWVEGLHLVGFCHDSILIEAPKNKAQEYLEMLSNIMIEEMKKVVTDVDVKTEGKISEKYS